MKTGWVRIYRQIEDNELWLDEKFTRGQAWLDLIIFANHKDGGFFVRGSWIKVKRGQIGWSQRTMAKRWKWSQGRVKRFLKWLKMNAQIDAQTSTATTVITIKNYDKFQENRRTDDAQTTHRQMTNKNEKNEKNEKNIKKNTSPFSPKEYLEIYNQLFDRKMRATDKIKKHLPQRLSSYKKEEIIRALTNLSNSKFHSGKNDRGWVAPPDFLIRNDEKVDEWLNDDGSKKKGGILKL